MSGIKEAVEVGGSGSGWQWEGGSGWLIVTDNKANEAEAVVGGTTYSSLSTTIWLMRQRGKIDKKQSRKRPEREVEGYDLFFNGSIRGYMYISPPVGRSISP